MLKKSVSDAKKELQESESGDPAKALIGLPKKITKLISEESDRGTILILAAYIDEILGYVVRASCTSDAVGRSLLENRAPAGDFSAKISLCCAFGLISPDEEKALNCLRRIRNSAAHFERKGRGFDVLFDSEKTVDLVAQLRVHLGVDLTSRKADGVRQEFVRASRLLASKLILRLVESKRAPKLKSNSEIADDILEQRKGTPLGNLMENLRTQARNGDLTLVCDVLKEIGDAVSASGQTSKGEAASKPKA